MERSTKTAIEMLPDWLDDTLAQNSVWSQIHSQQFWKPLLDWKILGNIRIYIFQSLVGGVAATPTPYMGRHDMIGARHFNTRRNSPAALSYTFQIPSDGKRWPIFG